MWYFTWVLGAGFACAFAVLNAMWLEIREGDAPARLAKTRR
ncbi:MAG TPA: cytochrome bd-I oxidase subunit CydX [Bauldia sp.]|nr:cytochrome bd-I oxidase subunit CydX [Bauldia sp.]